MSTSRGKGQAELALQDDLADALGVAAQAEGIARARGLDADADDADDGIDLVGQRQQRPAQGGGDVVLQAARLVMLGDGPGHVLGQAFGPGVQAAHHALQGRELADHVRQQVGLAQLGGRRGVLGQGLGPGLVAEIDDDLLQPLGLVVVGAELFLEEHVLQAGRPFAERRLAVLLPEEAGVRQPGLENALVALSDEALGIGRRYRRRRGRGAAVSRP